VKLFNLSILLGLILLYFVNAALKVDLFSWEMVIHSGIRFLVGFIVLGIGYFYGHKLNLKIAVYVILALLIADDVMDYARDVTRLSAELLLHNLYMLLWGALSGFLFMRSYKGRIDNQ
jgi:hypothetical protein